MATLPTLQATPPTEEYNRAYFVEVHPNISEEGYVIVQGTSFQISAQGDLAVVDKNNHRVFGLPHTRWDSIFQLNDDFTGPADNFVTPPTEAGWLQEILDNLE